MKSPAKRKPSSPKAVSAITAVSMDSQTHEFDMLTSEKGNKPTDEQVEVLLKNQIPTQGWTTVEPQRGLNSQGKGIYYHVNGDGTYDQLMILPEKKDAPAMVRYFPANNKPIYCIEVDEDGKSRTYNSAGNRF
jgi:hypothetical protein